MPTEPGSQEPPEPSAEALPALIEALLFVSDGPVEEGALARALQVPRRTLERALQPLAESLAGRGVRLQRGPEGAQLITAPEAAPYVEYFLGLEEQRRLSSAALETLAIVAYRQPVTRATVEAVRGVNSDASIATLRARGLLDEGGRAPGPGRPTLFVTTQRFLEHFGLERPEDLPPLEDLDDHDLPPPDATLPLPFDEGDEGDGRDRDDPAETSPAAADATLPLPFDEDAEEDEGDGRDDDRPAETSPAAADATLPLPFAEDAEDAEGDEGDGRDRDDPAKTPPPAADATLPLP